MPCRSSTIGPQCPWSVYSHKQTSAQSARDGTSRRSAASARGTGPRDRPRWIRRRPCVPEGRRGSPLARRGRPARGTPRRARPRSSGQQPGMDGISRRCPSPPHTNSGATRLSGDSRVSRTCCRSASVRRRRRSRWVGKLTRDPPRSVARCRARPSASASTSGADASTSAVAPNRASAAAVFLPSAATTTRPVKSRSVPSANARASDVALDGEQNETASHLAAGDGRPQGRRAFRPAPRRYRSATGAVTRAPAASAISSSPDGRHRIAARPDACRPGPAAWLPSLAATLHCHPDANAVGTTPASARAAAVTGPTAATLMRPATCGQRRLHA